MGGSLLSVVGGLLSVVADVALRLQLERILLSVVRFADMPPLPRTRASQSQMLKRMNLAKRSPSSTFRLSDLRPLTLDLRPSDI